MKIYGVSQIAIIVNIIDYIYSGINNADSNDHLSNNVHCLIFKFLFFKIKRNFIEAHSGSIHLFSALYNKAPVI